MCIIFVHVCAAQETSGGGGGYKLIVASNRDEFYARPTMPAAVWPAERDDDNDPDSFVLGGRDMEPGRQGGTWLAVGNGGGRVRLAALLNITGEPHTAQALGRGFLCGNYVQGGLDAAAYCDRLVHDPAEYNAFNLVTVELGYVHYWLMDRIRSTDKVLRSSSTRSAHIRHCSNAPATNQEWPDTAALGFGNSPPHTPLAKVSAGRRQFDEIVHSAAAAAAADRDKLVANLMGLLQDQTKCWPDAELARRAPNWGRDLSSICVRVSGDAGYGTR